MIFNICSHCSQGRPPTLHGYVGTIFGNRSAGLLAFFILWLVLTTTGRFIVGPFFFLWVLRWWAIAIIAVIALVDLQALLDSEVPWSLWIYGADRRARHSATLVGLYYCCCGAAAALRGSSGADAARARLDRVYLLAWLQMKRLYL